ncbi:unnamed protein product, partial [Timema podura]|nr:unnamed protein product [Timema podura]
VHSVHLRQEERLLLRVGREGGLQSFELHGLVTLRIANEKWGRIRVQLDNKDIRGIQLQTHPNVDKDLFKAKSQIGLKNPTKPFPLHTDVGVLKWRFQAQDETCIPLSSESNNFTSHASLVCNGHRSSCSLKPLKSCSKL